MPGGRNPLALQRAVVAAFSCGRVEIALALLQVIEHHNFTLRTFCFWPVFIAGNKSDGEKGRQYVQIFLFSISFSNPKPKLTVLMNFVLDFNVFLGLFQSEFQKA